jgi:hypothetical protein
VLYPSHTLITRDELELVFKSIEPKGLKASQKKVWDAHVEDLIFEYENYIKSVATIDGVTNIDNYNKNLKSFHMLLDMSIRNGSFAVHP